MGRISTILDLAKYRIGQEAYAVMFRPVGVVERFKIPAGEEWMEDAHPKVFYERKIASKGWKYRSRLPRLHAADFQNVVTLLTSEPIVEIFKVTEIIRSVNTGEFYYSNNDAEWMPEGSLFETPLLAKCEKRRIKKLVAQWANQQSTDQV
jgi:hypothetical protein